MTLVKRKVVPYTLLVLLSLVFAAPLLWLLSTSLKSKDQLFVTKPLYFPSAPRWQNYADVFHTIDFVRLSANTLLVTLLTVAGLLISAPLVAYATSHIEWRGKKPLFAVVLATLLLPYQVTMVPLYIVWSKLGAIGTYVPLVLPAFLSAGAGYYVFLMRQFFMTIPNSLVQAARIDGASEMRIYAQIMLPLCKPVIATVGVLVFLSTWSDFLGPLLYLNDERTYTLSLGLYAFMQTHYVEWEQLMAASAMFTVPIIVLFFLAQKQFIEGIALTGIKG
ncbi:carbohydrate ABC transporter permease [Cohnella nanjingensis]|uniref:Carbohydrate ABC transporter permease n=1 Tax=Cohnella nanjingensis TaxID=1387779 RepID=A0A7X0VIM5_9BACL|nr:carbohydrate ABC transporter permease [Cohnella nanjingensis]MBB6675101.1 carbohydrate ABC transporter permease [Cohnella nanjingensis]